MPEYVEQIGRIVNDQEVFGIPHQLGILPDQDYNIEVQLRAVFGGTDGTYLDFYMVDDNDPEHEEAVCQVYLNSVDLTYSIPVTMTNLLSVNNKMRMKVVDPSATGINIDYVKIWTGTAPEPSGPISVVPDLVDRAEHIELTCPSCQSKLCLDL